MTYVGEFDYSMDPKGRVVLPARLRAGFDEHAYVSCYVDGCLAVWTTSEFEGRYIERARRLDKLGREGRDIARAMASQSSFVDFDSQWRITIAPNLREYARLDLEKPVKIVGAVDHIEVWEPGRWNDRLQPGLAFLRSGAAMFDEDEVYANGKPPIGEVGTSAAPGGAARRPEAQ